MALVKSGKHVIVTQQVGVADLFKSRITETIQSVAAGTLCKRWVQQLIHDRKYRSVSRRVKKELCTKKEPGIATADECQQ